DHIEANEWEEQVFDLNGVRYSIQVDRFPYWAEFELYLLLSSPRRGTFPGQGLVWNDQTGKLIFYGAIRPRFEQDHDFLPLILPIRCRFPDESRVHTLMACSEDCCGHLWSVKLAPAAAAWWCVYLMRRGRWWRVGKSKLLSTWGFGVKHRLKTES